MSDRSEAAIGEDGFRRVDRQPARPRLVGVVTVGAAVLAVLLVVLGISIVSRLEAADDASSRVAEARRHVDLVDDLTTDLVLRASEPRGPLNTPELIERRGPVIEAELRRVEDVVGGLGPTAQTLGTDARLDRLVDAVRGMTAAGAQALSAEASGVDERALLDVFYGLVRQDLTELDEMLTELQTASIREQIDGINTVSLWILLVGGVSAIAVIAAGVAARRLAKHERSLLELMGRRATEDPLTGLLNRRGFRSALERSLVDRNGRNRPAVLFLDLDGFKQVNDSLGHQIGDQLLQSVGQRIVSCTRGTDVVGRLGGDEYAVLLRWGDGVADPVAAAHRIRRALMGSFQIAGQAITIGVSIGLRRIDPGETNADELLRDADVAMYEAKRRPGGGLQVFGAGLVEAVQQRLEMDGALRSAITCGGLDVAYQPVFSADGELVAAEALARWTHDGTPVPPDQFLSLAGELGLMSEVDEWVLMTATHDIAALNRRFGLDLRVAVNMTAEAFGERQLRTRVEAVLEASGLPADRLVVEITEQGAITDIERASASLSSLRSLGVAVALDDFGTGHSALAYLERLPIDLLKIDRSFLPADGDYGRARELFIAVVDLGRRLGFDVVAEGIETGDQLRLAEGAGCRLLQGYLLGGPGTVEALGALAADAASVGAAREAVERSPLG